MSDNYLEPASPFVLTREEHALIGEMVEILGWTDDLMAQMVARADPSIQFSQLTNIARRTSDWAAVMRRTQSDPAIMKLIDVAADGYPKFAEFRNDFVHALFENDYVDDYVEPGYQTTSATRQKTGNNRPTSDLDAARDKAAEFSCLFAHIDFCTRPGADPATSPWRSRIDASVIGAAAPTFKLIADTGKFELSGSYTALTGSAEIPAREQAKVYFYDTFNFLKAAELVATNSLSHFSPIYFLISHTLELALKAYILASGGTKKEVLDRETRHNLKRLYERATSLGFRLQIQKPST